MFSWLQPGILRRAGIAGGASSTGDEYGEYICKPTEPPENFVFSPLNNTHPREYDCFVDRGPTFADAVPWLCAGRKSVVRRQHEPFRQGRWFRRSLVEDGRQQEGWSLLPGGVGDVRKRFGCRMQVFSAVLLRKVRFVLSSLLSDSCIWSARS